MAVRPASRIEPPAIKRALKARDGGCGYDGEVYTLYVDPAFLGRGAGRALLAGAFEAFKNRKLKSCLIWAHAQNNACFFYEAMGGRRVATRTTRLLGELTPEIGFGWKRLATRKQARSIFYAISRWQAKMEKKQAFLGRVVDTGKPIVVPQVSREPMILNRVGQRKDLDKKDVTFVCVPFFVNNRPVGALGVDLEFEAIDEDAPLVLRVERAGAAVVRVAEEIALDRKMPRLSNPVSPPRP